MHISLLKVKCHTSSRRFFRRAYECVVRWPHSSSFESGGKSFEASTPKPEVIRKYRTRTANSDDDEWEN